MKKVAIIQARMGSRRLPGKAMVEINSRPLIWHIVNRARQSKVDEVILATTDDPKDDILCDYMWSQGVMSYRGAALDLLSRYWDAVEKSGADIWTQIYGDCPCIDPSLIDKTLDNIGDSYCCYTAGYPRGLNAYSFTADRLRWAKDTCVSPHEKEFHHQFMSFGGNAVVPPWEIHGFEFCVDTTGDLEYIRSAYRDLGDNFHVNELVLWAMEKAVNSQAERVRNI